MEFQFLIFITMLQFSKIFFFAIMMVLVTLHFFPTISFESL